MRSSHRPRPKQAHDLVARSWSRCLSWPKPAAPGTPLGLLEPIGQQHIQHTAEARSALARGAMMGSRRRCAIVHATRRLPHRQAALRQRQTQIGLNCFLVRARARRKLSIDRASVAHCPGDVPRRIEYKHSSKISCGNLAARKIASAQLPFKASMQAFIETNGMAAK